MRKYKPLFENFNIKEIGLKGKTFWIEINGHPYGYLAPSGQDIEKIVHKFHKMIHKLGSYGKAFSWLKKNTRLRPSTSVKKKK
jgi:hypothetical protein